MVRAASPLSVRREQGTRKRPARLDNVLMPPPTPRRHSRLEGMHGDNGPVHGPAPFFPMRASLLGVLACLCLDANDHDALEVLKVGPRAGPPWRASPAKVTGGFVQIPFLMA